MPWHCSKNSIHASELYRHQANPLVEDEDSLTPFPTPFFSCFRVLKKAFLARSLQNLYSPL